MKKIGKAWARIYLGDSSSSSADLDILFSLYVATQATSKIT
jgi:hypothetical protein